jgi:hypothetical protein
LNAQDWLDATKDKMENEEDYRKAMARLRHMAESRFKDLIQPALTQYAQANDGQMPSVLSQLQQYMT